MRRETRRDASKARAFLLPSIISNIFRPTDLRPFYLAEFACAFIMARPTRSQRAPQASQSQPRATQGGRSRRATTEEDEEEHIEVDLGEEDGNDGGGQGVRRCYILNCSLTR